LRRYFQKKASKSGSLATSGYDNRMHSSCITGLYRNLQNTADYRPILAACACLVICGCLQAPGPQRRSNALGPTESVPLLVLPLDRPRKVLDEYVYPEGSTRQGFAWGPFGTEWRVRHGHSKASYAGFVFKGECHYADRLDKIVLSFRMQPLRHDRDVMIGLVGRSGNKTVMTTTRLSEHRVREWGGWGLYHIRLTAFPEMGWWLDSEGAPAGRAAMDWSDVCEMRLIAPDGGHWKEQIVIRNIQFGPSRWAHEP
jgi:hypothetical protein